MKIFDRKGMLVIPDPGKSGAAKNVIVLESCSCQNGHQLVNSRIKFGEHSGIMLDVSHGDQHGKLGLSPVYGDKSRVSMDLDLTKGQEYVLSCPKCHQPLVSYGKCNCGAGIAVMFTDKPGDFTNCIGICTRAGCSEAFIKSDNELLSDNITDLL